MKPIVPTPEFFQSPARTINIQQGMLFIPDISGYTELVHTTDFMTGRNITYQLLSAIIDFNLVDLKIAEVEGDAVFFYRYGPPLSTAAILAQFELMLGAFHLKLAELERKYKRKFSLSLKAVAHYGKMAEFKIGGFSKLYGEVVIEGHRLLKNDVPGQTYVLITDDLIDECTAAKKEQLHMHGIRSSKLCEMYGGLREICFTFFDYSEVK